MSSTHKNPQPVHIAGMPKGEQFATDKGQEPGREGKGVQYRGARDSTGINPDDRKPIHPKMPSIPPS
jgi:hypothetical protein